MDALTSCGHKLMLIKPGIKYFQPFGSLFETDIRIPTHRSSDAFAVVVDSIVVRQEYRTGWNSLYCLGFCSITTSDTDYQRNRIDAPTAL